MLNILFCIVLWVSLSLCIQKRTTQTCRSGGLGELIAGCIVSAFLISLIRLPIYVFLYGWMFPFNPSSTATFWSGVFAVAFWSAMVWWRIPGLVCRAIGFTPKPKPPTI